MKSSKVSAKKLAKRILDENEKGRSYRTIAREDFPMIGVDGVPIIKAGTLNRIAKEQGNWLPKDIEILIALGLKKAREVKPEEWQGQKRVVKLIRRLHRDTTRTFKKAFS